MIHNPHHQEPLVHSLVLAVQQVDHNLAALPAVDKQGQMPVAADYTHQQLVWNCMEDMFAEPDHWMHMDKVVGQKQNLDKACPPVGQPWEGHRTGEDPAIALHMIVVYHTAVVQYNLVECLPVGKRAENFHGLHRDAVSEHDFHILDHHIHAQNVHNLDPVAVHSYNLHGTEQNP